MAPGGGIALLPYIRFIIGLLLVLTLIGTVVGIARIHMIILSFLAGGLLVSLTMFEREFKRVRGNNNNNSGSTTTTTKAAPASKQASAEKTD